MQVLIYIVKFNRQLREESYIPIKPKELEDDRIYLKMSDSLNDRIFYLYS